MIYGICPDCKKKKKPGWQKKKPLTKHSKTGNHQPPFIHICRECHDERHGITPNKTKRQIRSCKKYQPGTPHFKRKKFK